MQGRKREVSWEGRGIQSSLSAEQGEGKGSLICLGNFRPCCYLYSSVSSGRNSPWKPMPLARLLPPLQMDACWGQSGTCSCKGTQGGVGKHHCLAHLPPQYILHGAALHCTALRSSYSCPCCGKDSWQGA